MGLAQATEPEDAVLTDSPWVDLTLANVWFDERTSNFWNFGVQAGGYLFERLRISGRLVVPAGTASDEYDGGDSWNSNGPLSGARVPAPDVSAFYGGSLGVVVTNGKRFVFSPGVLFMRTDVSDYGSVVGVGLPFEWTTARSMRLGFEFGVGHSFGGHVEYTCANYGPQGDSCELVEEKRPSGTAILLQFYLGWAMGKL